MALADYFIPQEAKDLLQAKRENRLFVSEYSYDLRPRPFQDTTAGKRIAALLDAASPAAHGWLETIGEFLPELRRIPRTSSDRHVPGWINGSLPGLDGMFLYAVTRKLKPATFLEIGAGNSTKFIRRAISDGGLRTRLVSIDPHPHFDIDGICDETIRLPLERTDIEAVAGTLQPGDVVFIDNSHRSFQNSDVTVFFTEMLPLLPGGTLYGLHDILIPFDYPVEWADRFFNEQYLLLSYLQGGAAGDAVAFAGTYVSRDPRYAAAVNALFEGAEFEGVERHAGGFWMNRAAHAP